LGEFSSIGRLFSLGSFFRKFPNSPNLWDTFSKVKFMCVLILTKNGLGHILGDFLTNPSGHTDWHSSALRMPKLMDGISMQQCDQKASKNHQTFRVT
jgi:hypothetical protein